MSNIPFPIAVIVSRFNEPVTRLLKSRALARLEACGFTPDLIDVYEVPGAVEIPFVAQQCAKLNKYEAIACFGVVIRGETGHYDWVCEQASQGCQRVMLDYEVPVIFGVLTTENQAQAMARADGTKQDTGASYIDAAIEMAALARQFKA